MCALQGKKEGPPEILYGSIVDYYASALVAAGVSSALFERSRSGEGQFVGISLLSAALTLQSARLIWAENEGRDVGRDMRSGGITGLHPTKQGYLYISANTAHFWKALCQKVDLAEWVDFERYDSVRKRAQHQSEIIPKLHQALSQRSALEWEAHFGEEVPCSAARTIEDMFDHPQVLAQDMLTEFEHPIVGRYRGLKRSIKFDRTPGPDPFTAPTLGQHNHLIEQEIERIQTQKNKS
jgi:crotonobetainyl-CoA:carnitine CoA-transferase CaiB-like acyl-CoA transferase